MTFLEARLTHYRNQLTDFYMMATLVFNELIRPVSNTYEACPAQKNTHPLLTRWLIFIIILLNKDILYFLGQLDAKLTVVCLKP